MPLPVIDNALVVDVKSHTVVRGDVELVVVIRLWNEVTGPTNGKMVRGAIVGVAALSPTEIYSLIGACQGRLPMEFVIVKIFSPEARRPARGRHKSRLLHNSVERGGFE